MAFPETILPISVELWLGSGSGWVDISSDVRSTEPIVITRGRANESSGSEPSRCNLLINNRQGTYSPRRPASPYFGLLGRNTPIRVSVTTNSGTRFYRFTGEVAEWPPRWSEAELDAWVPIEANGILRRLGQSTPPLHDSLRRFISANGPLAYWPLTDPEGTLLGTEVAAGGQPMRNDSFAAGQASYGQGSLGGWLDPVVQTADKAGSMYVPVQPAAVTAYSLDFCFRTGPAGVRSDILMGVADDGDGSTETPRTRYTFEINTLDAEVVVFRSNVGGDNASTTLATVTPDIWEGEAHHGRLTLTASGTSTLWEIFIDGTSLASGTRTNSPLRPVSQLYFPWIILLPEEIEPVSFGHVVYWGSNPPPAEDCYRAMRGNVGERAGRRIERLCAEEGVPLRVTGSLDDTPQMGPQKPGALLELLDTCVQVDGGTLGEARDGLALAYRTNRSRYNQGVEV